MLKIAFVLFALVVWGPWGKLHAAYIDPQTNSALVQVIAPVFVAIALLGGFLKRWIRALFRSKKKDPDTNNPPEM